MHTPPAENSRSWSPGAYLLLFAAFAALCFALYRPALGGAFVSDDTDIFLDNPYVNELSWENVTSIIDPSVSKKGFTSNYAPVLELLVALERHFFGDEVLPYHAVNILFHALNAVLLIAWLRSSRLPTAAALSAGLLFAVHPANVEAVAWMSQLKTLAAMTFSLMALLALRSAPLAATLCFALALLTKASALFALPTAALLVWSRAGEPGVRRGQWIWVAVWTVVAGLYAVPGFASFENYGAVDIAPYADSAEQLRSIAAYGSRYLAMALTSIGLSAFHEPGRAVTLLDPWWLAALPVTGMLSWRLIVTLRRRSEEAAYWVAAAAGFAPISQIFPFLYPMGDRYLYFVLPGLLGGALFLAGEGHAKLLRTSLPSGLRGAIGRIAITAVVVLAAFFGFRSVERAGIWRNATRLYLDAERNYPDGGPANLLRARRAAQMGDVAVAVAALERAEVLGFADFMSLPSDRALAPIVGTPEFRQFMRDMAGRWILRSRGWPSMNQAQYHLLAHAHLLRDEVGEAQTALEKAITTGGPQDAVLRSELNRLRLNAPD